MQARSEQDPVCAATLAAVERFNDAFNRHDVEAVMAAMAPDCVFESTYPAPDGARYEGQDAVRGAVEEFVRNSPQATFEMEEVFACGDRAVARWLYRWVGADGQPGHIRGVDVLRVREGKVAESLAYVKG